jgi:hypothetical protein
MLKAGEICRVASFLSQEASLKILSDAKSKLERYLPYSVCGGSEQVLNILFDLGMASTLKTNKIYYKYFIRLIFEDKSFHKTGF